MSICIFFQTRIQYDVCNWVRLYPDGLLLQILLSKIFSSYSSFLFHTEKERISFPIRPRFSAILILLRNLYFTDYFIQLFLQNIDSICFEYVSFPFSVSPDLWRVSKPGFGLCQKIPVLVLCILGFFFHIVYHRIIVISIRMSA